MSRLNPISNRSSYSEERYQIGALEMAILRSANGTALAVSPVCRLCKCTDWRACAGGCHWVEPDLCSRCAAFEAQMVQPQTKNESRNTPRPG